MDGVISVVIPVYNVKDYLPQCLDSVIGQSYRALEIITVDDGSTDGSGNICDEYARMDRRITVIHQENGGAANAKNTALKRASGEFLAFLDSDDYLEPDAYEYMVSQLLAHQADVVQCSFRDVFTDRERDRIFVSEFAEFGVEEYLRRFPTDWTCGLLWDKLYRREIFDGISFEEGHKIDDEFFTYQGIMNARRIIRCPKVIYNYRKRASSIMQSPDAQGKIVLDKLDYLDQRRRKVAERFPELKQAFDYHFLHMIVALAKSPSATEESILISKKLLQDYRKERPRCRVEIPLLMQLMKVAYTDTQKLLGRRTPPFPKEDNDHYFR